VVKDPPEMVSAKVLSSKRESMASDNSGELPEAMDVVGLPTKFEPGMFKNDKDKSKNAEDKSTELELVKDVKPGGSSESKDVQIKDEETAEQSSSHKKHHHHHHSKVIKQCL